MRPIRHLVTVLLAAMSCASATAADRRDASYPTKPIRLLVPFTPGGSLALQKRHAQAHQVVEGIPMHHMFAAVHDVEVDLWLLLFQQFGAFTGVGAVFAAKDHQ